MTRLYLYAITDCPQAPMPAAPGLAGAPLLRLACQDIAAVLSPLSVAQIPPTEDNLWQHEAVVEALMADRAVLPVRFGTVLADEAAAQAVLETHYADFAAGLQRVRGRVELGLRVLWDLDEQGSRGAEEQPVLADRPGRSEGDSPPHLRTSLCLATLDCPGQAGQAAPLHSDSGRAYLMARLEEERQAQARRQQAEELVTELHAPLATLSVESTRQVLITPGLLLTAAYLVEQDQVAAFREAVEVLNATHPALRFLCTGPWPPYSFVTAVIPGSK